MPEQQTYTHYSVADIERYLQGRMNAKEMHDIERAALQDPFLADAIEGYRDASFSETNKHLDEIAEALLGEKQQAKVIALPTRAGRWWKVAMIIFIVAGAGTVTWYASNNGVKENKMMAAQQQPVNKQAQARDSVTAKSEDVAIQHQVEKKQTTTTKKRNTLLDTSKQYATSAYTLTNAAPAQSPGREFKADISTVDKNVFADKSDARADSMRVQMDSAKVNYSALQNNALTNNNSYLNNSSPYNNTQVGPSLNRTNLKNPLPDTGTIRLNITLKPSNNIIPVTVTDLRRKASSKPNLTDTTLFPQGGWESFNDYVFEKTRKRVDTTATAKVFGSRNVEIEFTVDNNGNASNLKVIKSLNDVSDAKALEIVKQWPGWITTKKDKKGKVVIQF